MTKTELIKKLSELNIPRDMYSFDSEFPSEAYVVLKTINCWEYYYSERGLKTGRIIFDSEEQAYEHLYAVLNQ
jgi:hypothetical protein